MAVPPTFGVCEELIKSKTKLEALRKFKLFLSYFSCSFNQKMKKKLT